MKTGDLKAQEIRDKVSAIAAIPGKKGTHLFSKFISNPKNLDQIFAEVSGSGITTSIFRKIHDFRQYVLSPEVLEEMSNLSEDEIKRYRFELQKIKNGVSNILKNLQN